MRFVIILFLLFCSSIHAEESVPDKPLYEVSSKKEQRRRENYPITSVPCAIESRVDPVTGDYVEENVDLIIAGAHPLTLRRFYSSSAPHDSHYAMWRYNPEHFAAANFRLSSMEKFAVVGNSQGGVAYLKERGEDTFGLLRTDVSNYTFSGQHHPLNTKLTYHLLKVGVESFVMKGEIVDGTGSVKKFKTKAHPWFREVLYVKSTFLGPALFTIYPSVWTPYQLMIEEERCPNGNLLVYKYIVWEKEEGYPRFSLLSAITLYNKERTRVLATLSIEYRKGKNKRIDEIWVTGSDGRRVCLVHRGKKIQLDHRVASFLPPVCYSYHNDKLTSVIYPEGLTFQTKYHPDGRVYEQYSSMGCEGAQALVGRYQYHPGYTEVWDGLLQKMEYHYNSQKRITMKKYFEDEKLYKVEEMIWDEVSGDLLRLSIKDGNDQEHFFTEYTYDKNHNLIKEKAGDSKGSHTTHRLFSDDGYNVLLWEKSPTGLIKKLSYLPGTNLCATEEYYEGETLKRKRSFSYDDAAACIKVIENDQEDGSYYRVEHIQPKKDMPCLGLPEIREERTRDKKGNEILLSKKTYLYTPSGAVQQTSHYDAEGNLAYTVGNGYDDRERVVWGSDAMGNLWEYEYDGNDHLRQVRGPREGMKKEIFYDQAGRPIKICEGTLITEKEYDVLGRVVAEIDASGFKTSFYYDRMSNLIKTLYADGRQIERQYNLLGHLIKETDLDGYVTLYTRDFRGEPVEIIYPDGSKEFFVYDEGGRCICKEEKNGLKVFYTYDAFDRLLTEKTYMKERLLREKSASYSAYTLLSTTDEMGVTTYYEYDSIGRKIAERCAGYTKQFFYDSLGRLYKRQEQGVSYIDRFDLLGNVIENRVEDGQGRTLRKRTYNYDASGNCTAVHTYKGTFLKKYDQHNQLIAETDPLGNRTAYQYEYKGGMTTSCTDAKGIVSITRLDCHGNMIESTKLNQLGEIIHKGEFLFDGRGNKIEERWERYQGTQFIDTVVNRSIYGPLNRLEQQIESDIKKTHFYYDHCGRLSRVITPKGSEQRFSYNELGYKSSFSGIDFEYRYTYDLLGRVTDVTERFSNSITTKHYNELGRVIYEKLANGIELVNKYDNWGRRVATTLPDGSSISYTYYGDRLHYVDRNDLRFYYYKRDLEGHISQVKLPIGWGMVTIERDELCRWQKMTSPYLQEIFFKDSYDSVGNLTHIQYMTDHKAWERNYSYDALNQLHKENEVEYVFDSLGNCSQKQGTNYKINALSQVIRDDKGSYSYDANGNLLSKEGAFFRYDSLDRLIEIEKKGMHIEYTYDNLHRRIGKKVNGKKTDFIWDGDDEIGCMEHGKIKEFRLLGEGFEAEVGSSLVFELGDKRYIPIHDHRGNIVQLIDVKTEKAVLTTYYSAFGQSFTEKGSKHSPWTFCSKREDPETHFIYFGRRYYMPDLERWLTADPAGFVDGPNLYSYVHNNPLTTFDAYGLFDEEKKHFLGSLAKGCFSSPASYISPYFFSGVEFIGKNFCVLPGKRDLLEAIGRWGSGHGPFWQKAEYWNNCSRIYTYPGEQIEGQRVILHNGMKTPFAEAVKNAQAISKSFANIEVEVHYNGDMGTLTNLCQAVMSKIGISQGYDQMSRRRYFSFEDDCNLNVIGHSQGGAYLNVLAKTLPSDIKNRMAVRTFGSAALIAEGAFGIVENYVSKKDIIPWGSPLSYGKALFNRNGNVIFLEPQTESIFEEHSFLGPTYQNKLKEIGRAFKK